MSESSSKLLADRIQDLKSSVSDDLWNSLSENDKIGIQTAELCIYLLKKEIERVDFSAAIIPLMKVLEERIIHDFYLPYLSFLKKNYTADTYITTNHLDGKDINPDDLRRKVIYYYAKNSEYRFCRGKNKEDECEFALGNYQFTVGADNYLHCDITAIEFYKRRFFPTEEESTIEYWICRMARSLDDLVDLRNKSAHAGHVKCLADADHAMNTLVKKDKLLFNIIQPKIEKYPK